MKDLIIPLDLKNFGRSTMSSITAKAVAVEFLKIVLIFELLYVFFAVISMMVDVSSHPMGLIAGSLSSVLGGKPNRRQEKPNFKIIADMGVGEKLPSRKQLQDEDEEHMWVKYPSLMLKKVLGGAA